MYYRELLPQLDVLRFATVKKRTWRLTSTDFNDQMPHTGQESQTLSIWVMTDCRSWLDRWHHAPAIPGLPKNLNLPKNPHLSNSRIVGNSSAQKPR